MQRGGANLPQGTSARTALSMSFGGLESHPAIHKAALLLAEGNIASSSDTFKPIFLGGVFIMFSGVFITFIVAEIIDRTDMYDEIGDELGG